MSEQTLPETTSEAVPASLDEVISQLKGFGIEENEEILSVTASGRTIRFRISNVATEEEITSLMAVDDAKNYVWVQRIKAELLSRAISWISLGNGPGINLRDLPEEKKYVVDPTDGNQKLFQVALRNIILSWGQEVMQILWKVLMVHSQRIEDRLRDSFPESVIMTKVEERFFEQAMKEIEEMTRDKIASSIDKALEGIEEEAPPKNLNN